MGIRDHLLPQPASFAKKKEFTVGETLGRGTFGKVQRATWHKAPPPGLPEREVALKVIPKSLIKGQESSVFDEIAVLRRLDHPGIVKCFDSFESRDKHYLVFELAVGGELFDRVTDRGKFTEKDAIETISAILSAVAYLHAHDIVHRDLKPENVLYRTREPHSGLTNPIFSVIADFGIAKHLEPDELLTTAAGSLGYAAPEILMGKGHGKPVDLWSMGIITFVLLCGYTPFRSDDQAELIRETTRGRLEFHERYWKNVTQEAKDFITSLVQVDPAKRPTAEQALQHPWLALGDDAPEHHDLSAGIKTNYAATRKWRSAIRTIQATRRMQSNTSSATTSTTASSPTKEKADDTDDDEHAAYHTAEEEENGGHGLRRQGEAGGMGERLDVREPADGQEVDAVADKVAGTRI